MNTYNIFFFFAQRFRWAFWFVINIIGSIAFLLCSNCFISMIIPENSWRWFGAYRDAMSFRFSHYFISYLSQAMMVIAGFANTKENSSGTSSKLWGYQITKPVTIEWPRSIVQVVISWNISMHNWLKTCKCFLFPNNVQHFSYT